MSVHFIARACALSILGQHDLQIGTFAFAPYLKRAHEGLIHTHHGTSVVKLSTIVRR